MHLKLACKRHDISNVGRCITSKRDIMRHVHVSGDYAAPPLPSLALWLHACPAFSRQGCSREHRTPETWDTASCLWTVQRGGDRRHIVCLCILYREDKVQEIWINECVMSACGRHRQWIIVMLWSVEQLRGWGSRYVHKCTPLPPVIMALERILKRILHKYYEL